MLSGHDEFFQRDGMAPFSLCDLKVGLAATHEEHGGIFALLVWCFYLPTQLLFREGSPVLGDFSIRVFGMGADDAVKAFTLLTNRKA